MLSECTTNDPHFFVISTNRTCRAKGSTGVYRPWTEIWNGTVEWKMEWNGECTIIAN